MISITNFKDFKNINSLFKREHNKIIEKYNIDFISLKGTKFPIICLYEIVFILFKNNSINLKISDIIFLTLYFIGVMSKEDDTKTKEIYNILIEKKLINYTHIVRNTIKSIKNLLNISLKKDGLVIQNIEQALKYKYSIDVLSLIKTFIKVNNVVIKDFCNWYLIDKRSIVAKDLIKYIDINY